MRVYAPPRLRTGRPLVVVLHGCGQDAASFATDGGWLSLADQYRLALLLPGQVYGNNHGRCFNWFRPQDTRRGGGEAMSIRQMLRHAIERFGSDRKQIFVAGFSAGAGMAAALLAAYPAVFAAGGVVAGMPVGSADSQMAALIRMRRPDALRGRMALAEQVRAVTRARGRRKWPRLSIWQGARDRTVAPGNAEVLAAQWSELHNHGEVPAADATEGPIRRRVWTRDRQVPSVELWTIANLGHGFPIARGVGRPGPWVTDAGISAAGEMAAFWGLQPLR